MRASLPPSPPAGTRLGWLGTALKLVLAGILIAWLVSSSRFDFATLLALRPGWPLAGLVAGLILSVVCQVWRWLRLVRAQGFELSAGAALQIGLIGMFSNTFLPSGLGLDGAKIYYLAPLAKQRKGRLISSLVIDRLLGLGALLLLMAVLSSRLMVGLGGQLGRQILSWSALALLAAVIALALIQRLGRPPAGSWLHSLSRALADYRRQPGVLTFAFLLSLVGHLFSFFASWCAFAALGLGVSPRQVLQVAPAIQLASSIPTTPMALGVTDSVAAVLYQQLAIGGGAETVMLARAVTVVLSLACAGGLLLNYLPLAEEG